MTDYIEEIAKLIYAATEGNVPPFISWGRLPMDFQEAFRDEAREAIKSKDVSSYSENLVNALIQARRDVMADHSDTVANIDTALSKAGIHSARLLWASR